MLKLWGHRHDWTKWGPPHGSSTSYHLIQFRTCTSCGKTQKNTIDFADKIALEAADEWAQAQPVPDSMEIK